MAEEDICAKEIESWSSYEYALRKENGEYFHNMLESRCSVGLGCTPATNRN